MRAVATAVVTAPPDQVRAALADRETMSAWGPGVTVTLTEQGAPDRDGASAGTRTEGAISADQRVPLAEKAAIKTVATMVLRPLVRAVGK